MPWAGDSFTIETLGVFIIFTGYNMRMALRWLPADYFANSMKQKRVMSATERLFEAINFRLAKCSSREEKKITYLFKTSLSQSWYLFGIMRSWQGAILHSGIFIA